MNRLINGSPRTPADFKRPILTNFKRGEERKMDVFSMTNENW